MSFEVGRTYSGYQFLELVKTTRTTVAYKVRNLESGGDELLYVLPEGPDDSRRRDRFMREMNLRARLVHPNIPAFLNATEMDGHLVMTTELVEGRTLAEALESGPLPWRDAARFTQQILSALACAHELHVVHRDVSPDNLVITAAGEVMLTNFGFAKGANSPLLTQVGTTFGNAAYMSPEMVRATGELDSRSDIYSLGAVLYHMLCGRPPFAGSNEFEVMVAQVKEAPQPPSAFHPGVPTAFDSVALKALAKEPADRYPGCTEFAAALDVAVAAPQIPQDTPKPKAAGARWTLLGSAAAGIAVLLLAIWFIARA